MGKIPSLDDSVDIGIKVACYLLVTAALAWFIRIGNYIGYDPTKNALIYAHGFFFYWIAVHLVAGACIAAMVVFCAAVPLIRILLWRSRP